MLQDDVERVVAENAPCMVLAVNLGPAETGTGDHADSLSVIQALLDGATADDVLSGLAGLKAGYSRLVEIVADTLGDSDQNLHLEVNRRLDETPIQEVGEAALGLTDQTPEQAADRLARDYKAYLQAVQTTADALGMSAVDFGMLIRKRGSM